MKTKTWKPGVEPKQKINIIKLVRLKSKISLDLINNKESNLNKDYNRMIYLVKNIDVWYKNYNRLNKIGSESCTLW